MTVLALAAVVLRMLVERVVVVEAVWQPVVVMTVELVACVAGHFRKLASRLDKRRGEHGAIYGCYRGCLCLSLAESEPDTTRVHHCAVAGSARAQAGVDSRYSNKEQLPLELFPSHRALLVVVRSPPPTVAGAESWGDAG